MGSINNYWQQAAENIAKLEVFADPFPYSDAVGILPDLFYDMMTAHLPETEAFIFPCEHKGVSFGCEDPRCIIDFDVGLGLENLTNAQRDFWLTVTSAENTMLVTNALLSRFHDHLDLSVVARSAKGFGVQPKWLLSRSLPGFELPPHEDTHRKMLAALFYLPTADRESELGTILIRPKRKTIRQHPTNGGRFHPDDFIDVRQLPFRRNGFLAFPRSANSFHRVAPLPPDSKPRDILMFNIMFAHL